LGGDGLGDAQLLERFVATGDEAAFELLVWRHERLIFGLCRRILHDRHDAEDAFQATFLALARKAASIVRREALASWLYQVAYRTALTARARKVRQTACERPGSAAQDATLPADAPQAAQRAEIQTILDEEVNRLPVRFRAPTVLCYLEGKTVEEAAELLGCPRGTVASRLARARERLRVRLIKRGVTLPAGAAAMLTWAGASTAASPALIRSAAALAARAKARGDIPVRVITLTQEVLRAMSFQKLTKAVAVLATSMGMLLLGGGLTLHFRNNAAAEPLAVAASNAPQPQGAGDEKPAPPQGVVRPVLQPRVVQPIQREIAPFEDFPGRLEAAVRIEIRAQVGGMIQQIQARAGRDVKRGDLLFEMDPRALQEKLARAEAGLAAAEARRKLSATDLERVRRLVQTGGVSRDEVDKVQASAAVDEAAYKIAQLDVERARRDLATAQITAPVAGRVGRILVQPGSLVSGVDGQGTVLTTLTVLNPIHVGFDMDERSLLQYQRLLREGQVKDPGSSLFMGLADDKAFPREGKLESIDNQFDPKTGTIRVRGVFPNPGGELLPGMFARVRMPFGKPRPVLEVPPGAVVPNKVDNNGHAVMVVNDKNVLAWRKVTVGPLDGNMRVITEGLRPSDWVISEWTRELEPGLVVNPRRVNPAKE
jgi:RND family efflux transporter MFP subunit